LFYDNSIYNQISEDVTPS